MGLVGAYPAENNAAGALPVRAEFGVREARYSRFDCRIGIYWQRGVKLERKKLAMGSWWMYMRCLVSLLTRQVCFPIEVQLGLAARVAAVSVLQKLSQGLRC